MVPYFGDFAENETVYIPFNTFSSDDPTASVTVTDLVDADIKVHKDGGTTEIATDGATVAINFDSVTGNHLITIDTSVHADYSTGSDYLVRIEGVTVDAGTINAWVGMFSIENRFNEVNVTQIEGSDATNQIRDAVVDDATRIDASALNTLSGHDPGDTIGTSTLTEAQVNAQCDAAIETYHLDHLLAADYDPASKPGVATALLNELVENDGGVSKFTANALEEAPTGGSAPTAEEIVNEWETQSQADPTGFHVNVMEVNGTPQTATNIADDLDNIEADTQDLQTQIGTYGAGLANLPWNSSWDSEVQSECTDALNAYAPPTRAELTSDINSIKGSGYIEGSHALDAIGSNASSINTVVNNIETDTQSIETKINTIDGIVDNILLDTNELQSDDVPGLIAALDTVVDGVETKVDTAISDIGSLNDLSAAEVWAVASARTDDYGTLLEQLADWHFNELQIVNEFGTATLRNKADSADLASWTINDDDTNTDRSAVTWS